jgi:dethiobiotin synthetase
VANTFIIAGIGTEIGKTVTSAIVTQKLQADYWKPVQAGELDFSDSHKIDQYTSHPAVIHPEAFRLNTPMSPHAAAAIDGLEVQVSDFKLPETENNLVVELAGGLLVPLNNSETNVDLIKHLGAPVILVANFYLGSINHTLLSVAHLKHHHIPESYLMGPLLLRLKK